MSHIHDLPLVAVSVIVAVFASYTALDLATRVRVSRRRERLGWLIGGSLAMGIGIWSMHFIGMLAFRVPGVPIAYDVPLWLASIGIAILASLLALVLAIRPRLTVRGLVAAGGAMGIAISGMHYTGMAALRVDAEVRYSTGLVVLSIAIAVLTAIGALWTAFRLGDEATRRGRSARAAGGLVMGLAISGMHYTGMAAVRIRPTHAAPAAGAGNLLATDALAVWVIAGTVVVLGLALTAVLADRRIRAGVAAAKAVRESEKRFRALVAANSQIICVSDAAGMLLDDQAQWGEYTGQAPSAYRGRGWLDAVHPDDRERLEAAWSAAIRDRRVLSAEHRLERHDGVYRDVSVRAVPVLSRDGSVREWVSAITDVTDEKRSREERAFLGEASRMLASSLDHEETLRTVARLAVSRVADWCVIDLVDEDEILRVAVAHREPELEALASALRRYPPEPDAPGGAARVIRTGRTEFRPDDARDLLQLLARSTGHRDTVDRLGIRSAIIVPLTSGGRTLGALSLVRGDGGARYDERDVELAEELGRRAAVAVDHARLYLRSESGRESLEHLTAEMDRQMDELQNQTAQLEENQLELEVANDELQVSNAKLASAKARYQRLVETSPYGVFVLDREARYTEINPAGERIVGRPSNRLIGEVFSDFIQEQDVAPAAEAFRQLMSGEAGSLKLDLSVLRPAGERRVIHVAVTGVRDEANRCVVGVHGVFRDVTQDRRTRESLQESEASYRLLFDSVSELVYIQDLDGRFINVNQAVVRRYGYPREEIIGNLPDMLADRERTDLSMVQEMFGRAAAGAPQSFAFWGRTLCGESFPKEVSLTRGRYFGQDVVIAVARDVSERLHAEELRRESEERFRSVVESLGEAVLITDLDDRVQYANPRVEEVLGYAPEELVGRIAGDLLIPEAYRADFARRMETRPGGVSDSYEVEQRRKDGTLVWTEVHGSPLRDAAGEIVGTVGAVADISARKRAEAERIESERREQLMQAMELERSRLTALFEQAPAFIALLGGPDHVFEVVNGRFQQLIGNREVAGMPIRQAIPELGGQGHFELLDRVYETGEARVGVGARLLLQRSGDAEPEERFVNFVYQPFVRPDGSASGIFVHGVDVTDLARARQEAEAANQAKSAFLSRMSHELRTPLHAILGFGQLLQLETDGDEERDAVTQILRAGEHLLSLIDEVLDIARIEAGHLSLSLEPVSVREVITESLDLVRLTAAKQGIRLLPEAAVAEEHFVRADQQRLKQVLLNLLSNAIKYNLPEGTVTLSATARGDRVRIAVRDTGRGISDEMVERLFTPFDRLGAERGGVEGVGLGLALSKGLVEAMGGEMGVDTAPGRGSRFWVDLSLAAPPATAEPAERIPAPRVERPAAPARTVLLVEDNAANVRLVERIFKRRTDVRLLTAMQGTLALELAREHRPDLVLLDLNLPDLSGDEILVRLRQDPAAKQTPVLMLSGDATPSQVQRLLDLGAQGYLTKPFDIQQFLRMVEEQLGT